VRIGVTGGAGFIGSAVRRVAGDEHEIVNFDHPHDVRAFADVEAFVADVEGVIHLAGILGTAETLGHEHESIDVNIVGALNVAQACQRHDVPMVQIGTGHRGQPNVYAITKACAEDLVLARVQWSGLRANVVRAFHAYGPGQKAPPPYGHASVRKIIPAFVCAALAGDRLQVNGTGQQVVDLIHVDDVARTLLYALDRACVEVVGHTFEAGTSRGISVQQAAYDVIAACESTSTIELVPMRAGEPSGTVVVADHYDPFEMLPARFWGQPGWLDDTIAYYREMLGA
jgi:UDP-glucose 4-epimerase